MALNAVGGGESGKNVIKSVSRYYVSRLMVDHGPREKMSSEWVSTLEAKTDDSSARAMRTIR